MGYGVHVRRVALAVVLLALPAPAAAAPGPPLREDPGALDASLECSGGIARGLFTPVVLVHGTTSSPEDSFGWGYRKVLPEAGRPACTVRLPERATVDLQRSAEYVAHAVRTVARRAPGRRVNLLGHSQGAFHAVFTAKFWPDLRRLVDDAVVLAGPFSEAEGAQAGCNPASCSPPFRQRQKGAKLFGAFLAARLPQGPSFTSILTLNDEITRPQPASSTLPGATNITLQDVCPGRSTEHLGMLGDAVVYQLAIDAFDHGGGASPERIVPACDAGRFAGSDDAGYAAALASALVNLFSSSATAEQSPTEPPVRCYLDRRCADVDERGRMLTAARRVGRRLVLRVQAPGKVRVAAGRRVALTRRAGVGRRVLRLPRRRGRLTIATRPDGYARYLVERRIAR